jgi:hypothetical protein
MIQEIQSGEKQSRIPINKIIAAINRLDKMAINPEELGEVATSEGNIVIRLDKLQEILDDILARLDDLEATPVDPYEPWQLVPCDVNGVAQPPESATHTRLVAGDLNDYPIETLGFNLGDNPPTVLAINGLKVWLTAERVSGGVAVQNPEWSTGTTPPEQTDELAVLVIGEVSSTGTVSQSVTGHLTLSWCRDWFSIPADYSAVWGAI